MTRSDAVVVGAGPNGLAAAIALAHAGVRVQVREAAAVVGGGCRSEYLTLPGFLHDVCSAVYPLAVSSPFFRRLPLDQFGLRWIEPPAAVAHPFDDGSVALLERSTAATGAHLGVDGPAWRRLMDPFVRHRQSLFEDALGPLNVPRHPVLMARFGMVGLLPASLLARRFFRTDAARALFTGIAAHATLPLDQPPSAAFGMVLGIAGHAVGWPIPTGGARRVASALGDYFCALGGEIVLSAPVASLDELPAARAVLLDVTPRQVLGLAGDRLPTGYARTLRRYAYGLGTFKVDWALDGPIPWRNPACLQSATVHLGGTFDELVVGRRQEWAGQPAERPFVILAQPSLFDPSRAPAGGHTAWAYCHVPNGSSEDMTERIEEQVVRFAPGFRARIIGRQTMGPAALERHNANLVGGDISGGEVTLRQLFFRPAPAAVPYATPLRDVFLCSSSTPPGGGVHGMCGYHAARVVLRRRF